MDQSAFFEAAAKSVIDPSPANVEHLLNISRVESIGAAEAARVRHGLLAILEDPHDEDLGESEQKASDAAKAVQAARDQLEAARQGLNDAEAAHIRAQEVLRIEKSRRLDADRARQNPNVIRAMHYIDAMEAKSK